ncbi:MAG: DUF3530 family protein [Pseudomonadota bacterium]
MYNTYKKNPIRQVILLFSLVLHANCLVAQETISTPEESMPTPAASKPNEPEQAPNATSGEESIFASDLDRDNALLALALPNEIQWLDTPHGKIIALFKAGEKRKTLGSLLILHATELPQLWPAPLESLRRNLPLYGWDTMTVPLPSLYISQSSTRELIPTTSSSNAQSSNQAVVAASSQIVSSPRTQLINERITAAISLLTKIGQPNLVVLVDNSTAPDNLLELSKNNIQAVILVNLQNHEPLTHVQLAAIFSNTDLPVLDVFFGADDKYQIAVRRLHQAEAMRKNLKSYQQLLLPPENIAAVNNKQSFWLEKVRGFINKTLLKPSSNK